MTIIITLSFVSILIIGFVIIRRRYSKYIVRLDFAEEYRDKLIALANGYFQTYSSWERRGNVNNELYSWLTKNVNLIQSDLGSLGTLHYVAPFQIYQINNYQIIINTIPKFRAGNIEKHDIDWADDCLLRYMGVLEKTIKSIEKKLKNPFILFMEGFKEIVSLPLYVFNWFGILSDNAVANVTKNIIFNVLAGIGGLVTFASGVVTIIQGKEQTISLFKQLFHK